MDSESFKSLSSAVSRELAQACVISRATEANSAHRMKLGMVKLSLLLRPIHD
jgi:hypothetical protein